MSDTHISSYNSGYPVPLPLVVANVVRHARPGPAHRGHRPLIKRSDKIEYSKRRKRDDAIL